MQKPRINAQTIRDQLKTKRNLLFEKFLGDPSNTQLAKEIRLIDDRIAELERRRESEQKSNPD
jgi:hypothetical protein